MNLLGDQGGRDDRGPVDAERAGRGGRGGGVEAGVAGQGELDDGVGKRAADLALVLVLDRYPQVRGGLLVGGRVRMVEAEQADVELAELPGAAEHLGQQGDGVFGLGLDVQAGQHHRGGVAVAAEHVQRDLEGARRRAAQGAGQRDPVRAGLGQPDRVEVGDDVGVEVGGVADLVEQLGGDGADRDQAAGAVVLGDDAAAVAGHLGDREARVAAVGDLVQEAVVAAGGLRAALDDVTGGDRAGQGVPVVPAPAVPPGGGSGDQARVGDPRAYHDVRPGLERGGDAPAAEVGVGRDHGQVRLGQRDPGVEVDELVAGRLQVTEGRDQVVAGDVGDAGVQPEPGGEFGD